MMMMMTMMMPPRLDSSGLPDSPHAALATALVAGMVLVLSEWVDYSVHMLWLDSLDPSNGTATTPGVSR
jgi:hypothetical protein